MTDAGETVERRTAERLSSAIFQVSGKTVTVSECQTVLSQVELVRRCDFGHWGMPCVLTLGHEGRHCPGCPETPHPGSFVEPTA